MNLYFISGLGVDERVFQKLKLPTQYTIHYINWIIPQPKETIEQYARRLAVVIDHTRPFCLIGLSFGGMIASEMSKFLQPVQTILISSASNKKQVPPYYKWAGLLRLDAIVPYTFLKKPNPLFYWLFGITTKEEKILFKQILKDTDTTILKWSIHAIINWRNTVIPPHLIHIHGDNDHVLPVQFTKPTHIIKGGKHFMAYTKAAEISLLLTQLLQSYTSQL